MSVKTLRAILCGLKRGARAGLMLDPGTHNRTCPNDPTRSGGSFYAQEGE
ncbi:hypothetical protein GCM10010401_07250 [Rarobacter faecitabidus]|uniref:Uncharacterized protein n=1 Tax=Rarobacter faecitabidus TaxID=13243 RepID=A0A542Z871_RARFA|nr:hypothetical protein FB461_2416 [Rarobacter faecitabidus]